MRIVVVQGSKVLSPAILIALPRKGTSIDDILDGAIRDEVANRTMVEIVRSSNRKMSSQNVESSSVNIEEMTKNYSAKGARLEIIKSILESVSRKLLELNGLMSFSHYTFG